MFVYLMSCSHDRTSVRGRAGGFRAGPVIRYSVAGCHLREDGGDARTLRGGLFGRPSPLRMLPPDLLLSPNGAVDGSEEPAPIKHLLGGNARCAPPAR